MKNIILFYTLLISLFSISAHAHYQLFQIRLKPNSPLPTVIVSANENAETYSQARLKNLSRSPLSSSEKNKELNSKVNLKTTLYLGKQGDNCNKVGFPKNTVIRSSGRQKVVDCKGAKVRINNTKRPKPKWVKGDPVLKVNKKIIKKKLKSPGLGDEMPEDFPEG